MMNKWLVLIPFLVLLAIPNVAEAVTINAQNTTTCNNGYCVTKVLLTDFMPSGLINALKQVDLTPAKPVLSNILTSFQYRFENNTMIFNGTVTKDYYWTFNLGNGFVIDPYWNYSVLNQWSTNKTLTWTNISGTDNNGGSGYYRGVVIKPFQTIRITKLTAKNSTVTLTNATVATNATACYASSVANNTAQLNCNLSVGYTYYVMIASSNVFYFYDQNPAGNEMPYNTTDFNVTDSAQGTNVNSPTTGHPELWMGPDVITWNNLTNTTYSVYYENHLYLNGNESNTTIYDNTTFNGTVTTNLTSAPVKLYINGNLSADDTDSAENITNLTAGTYNITGWFGNASTNETVTYWLTVLISPILNKTFVYCYDNETLAFMNVYNKDTGNLSSYWEYCPYECDNITSPAVCNPPTYQQNLYNFLIILGIIAVTVFLLRRRRR